VTEPLPQDARTRRGVRPAGPLDGRKPDFNGFGRHQDDHASIAVDIELDDIARTTDLGFRKPPDEDLGDKFATPEPVSGVPVLWINGMAVVVHGSPVSRFVPMLQVLIDAVMAAVSSVAF
jgi:hypothetical protein